MSRIKSIFHIVTCFVLFCGCTEDSIINQGNPSKPIALTRSEADCNDAAREFAFDLLKIVDEQESGKAYFFSPLSLDFTLGLLASGAEGETLQSICDVLGMNDIDVLNSYSKKLLEDLPLSDKKTTLELANLALFNHDIEVKENYRKTIENNYKSLVKKVNFKDDNTITFINNWISDKTKGTLNNVIDQSFLSAQAYFVLTNAMYFKGTWSQKSLFETVRKEEFNRDGKQSIMVDMMTSTMPLDYFGCDNYTMLKLPYGNRSFTMNIILPDPGRTVSDIIPNVKKTITSGLGSVSPRQTKLVKIPKFKGSFHLDIRETLDNLGVKLDKSNFNNMFINHTGDGNAIIINSWQDGYIEVNEKGTEASSTTVIAGMSMPSLPNEEFIADRPFLYMIMEESTGAILFIGKYTGE